MGVELSPELALIERIKQMIADRKNIFGVEGDGVDLLLRDCWSALEELEGVKRELRSWQDAAQYGSDV